MQRFGQLFGQRALAAGRPAVYRNDYILHEII
jgi:hypothetical protein